MKKKQAPILLSTVLGLLLVVVFIWNASNKGTADPHEQPKPEDTPKAAPLSDEAKKKVGDTMKGALSNKTKMASAVPLGAPGSEGAGATEPTVLMPKIKRLKPVPGDSDTTSQWYGEQAGHAKPDNH